MVIRALSGLMETFEASVREWREQNTVEFIESPNERIREYISDDEQFVCATEAIDRITPRLLILTESRVIEVSDWLDEADLGTAVENYPLESIAQVDTSSIVYSRLQIHMKDGTSEDWACTHAREFADAVVEAKSES